MIRAYMAFLRFRARARVARAGAAYWLSGLWQSAAWTVEAIAAVWRTFCWRRLNARPFWARWISPLPTLTLTQISPETERD